MTLVGLDFGTSHSSIAAQVGDVIRCVPDGGEPRVPSVVHAPRRGDLIVGASALGHALSEPSATVVSVKRLLGRGYDEAARSEVHAGRIVRAEDGTPRVTMRGEAFAPMQLAVALLRHLRDRAQVCLGQLGGAVLTAPVGATPEYLAALSRAAQLAGIAVRSYVAEPIAALVAVGAQFAAPGVYLVCDFGGGTFDVTAARWDGRVMTPLASTSDLFLGGDDFDVALVEGVASQVFQQHRVDLRRDVVTWGVLRARCESVKRQLSTSPSAPLRMREAYSVGGRTVDLDVRVEREWAEERWQPLVARATEVALRALHKAQIGVGDVAEVVLVGGTSQVPLVQRALAAALGRDVRVAPSPELAVVSGAAMIAALQAGRKTGQIQAVEGPIAP